MGSELAVNEEHAFALCAYLTFSRKERDGRTEMVKDVFENQKKKLKEAHYTREDVKTLLTTASQKVEIEMNKELVNMAHNTFLLIRQLMRQAEDGGVALKMNLSEMQNMELLKAVAQFERDIDGKKAERTATILKDPSLLENSLKNLSSDFVSEFYRNDLTNLSNALRRNQLEHGSTMSEMEKQMQSKDSALQQNEEFRKAERKRINDMETQHFQMKQRVDEIAAQLALKEAELEKKFQSTNTYLNMQKILKSKNDVIARLRAETKSLEAKDDE